MRNITSGKRPTLPEVSSHCPQRLRSLIERCWADDPTSRPKNFGEILDELKVVDTECEYNNSFEELVEKLKKGIVTFVGFIASFEYKNECERMQNSGRLD